MLSLMVIVNAVLARFLGHANDLYFTVYRVCHENCSNTSALAIDPFWILYNISITSGDECIGFANLFQYHQTLKSTCQADVLLIF